MLNEILEAEAYLCDVKSSDLLRVQPSNLTGKYEGKLNGLQDILVIIAREFIFTHMNATECTPEVHDACISALRLWCAFDDDETLEVLRKNKNIPEWLKKHPGADGWLKAYFEKKIKSNKNNKAKWEDYISRWKKRLLTPEEHLYTPKSFCYENILAEAIADGSLKVRYLVFKGNEEDFEESLTKPDSGLNNATYKKNYKFIAAVLLAMAHSERDTVYFRKLRFLNWIARDNDNLATWFLGLQWNGKDICERMQGKDFVKLKMNEEFIKNFDLKIIEEPEKDEYMEKKYTVLEDIGHNGPLEKNKLLNI